MVLQDKQTKEASTMQNNLFSFATKELSQDAFLCWLANWYNYNSPLKALSEKFLRLILAKNNMAEVKISSVSVLRQYNHIDVLLVINEKIAIIVEDKTYTSEHGDQIARYAKNVMETPIVDGSNSYKIDQVVCVYYKTAEYIYADTPVLSNNEIIKVTRKDMLALTEPYVTFSEILYDYYANLKALDDAYEETERAYLEFNYDEALRYTYMQWRYFKDCFSEETDDGEVMLPHDMSLPETQASIQQGSSFGTPYTWYWFLEFSKGVPENKKDTHGRYLGYRIDKDSTGTYLSLRMYGRYNKDNQQEKERQNSIFKITRTFIAELIEKYCPEVPENNFKIHFNTTSRMSYYECEFFRCYFNENISDKKSNDSFARLIRKIRNNLQIFV